MLKTRIEVAAAIGLALGSSAHSQDAVQWRVEDGGNGHWYQGIARDDVRRLVPAEQHCWSGLRQYADSIGGHLVTLPDAAEGQWVFANVVSDPRLWWYTAHANGPYIGAFKELGQWRWVTDEPWDYAPWGPAEPFGNGEIVTYWGRFLSSPTNAWNDDEILCLPTDRSAVIEWSADCNNDGIVDYGQIVDGTFADENEDGVPDCCDPGLSCDCPADLDGDGTIGPADLGILLKAWNTDGGPSGADLNGDGIVKAADLGLLVGAWGNCE